MSASRGAAGTTGGRGGRRWVAAATLALAACAPAVAHDTWFRLLGGNAANGALLSLGTGNRFPAQEFSLLPEQLVTQGCRRTDGPAQAMGPIRVQSTALILQTAPVLRDAAGPLPPTSCWMQTIAFEIELPPDKIPVYLDEIHATAAVRERWAALQAKGIAWKERYAKHARIEIAPPNAAIAATPSPIALDLRPDAGTGPWRPGEARGVQVLADDKPLAGLWLELVDERGASAGWQESDSDGRVRVAPPRAGRWLLRGTELRPAPDGGTGWVSRFVTLAFDVAGR